MQGEYPNTSTHLSDDDRLNTYATQARFPRAIGLDHMNHIVNAFLRLHSYVNLRFSARAQTGPKRFQLINAYTKSLSPIKPTLPMVIFGKEPSLLGHTGQVMRGGMEGARTQFPDSDEEMLSMERGESTGVMAR